MAGPPSKNEGENAVGESTESTSPIGPRQGSEPMPRPQTTQSPEEDELEAEGALVEPTEEEENERTRLLANYHRKHRASVCGSRNCEHGTFSPHPLSPRDSISDDSTGRSIDGFGGRYDGSIGEDGANSNPRRSIFGDTFVDGLMGGSKRRSNTGTTEWLANTHRVKHKRLMYLAYYLPFLRWITLYQWKWLQGDLIAALTMASFYIPMSLSYASNLGHIPPINGLYSFVFNPVIYALLGTCPQMVVGPEAAGSLLVGTVVRASVDTGHTDEENDEMHSRIAGVVTGMAGTVILVAGLCRLGFLDSVLSRPFLRGFISAIGFVILVEQLIPELGLAELAAEQGIEHGSSAVKLVFLVKNVAKSHALTAGVSLGAFAIIMFCRTMKQKLQPRYPSVAYIPDRFIVVVLSAILAWQFEWDKKGLEVLGTVRASGNHAFAFRWPYQYSHMHHISTALDTSFLIALLGFFESSVAAKSLGEGPSELRGLTLSANRELVALGVANVVGGCFMALPAFGGYGRSKVNKSTGGQTPMSSVFLSLFTLISVLYLLPYLYHLPKGVLSAMVSVVAYSLIEECPHDIRFFWAVRGWTELFLMFLIFFATVFYSLSLGMALGIGLSILKLIRHSTKPRIQILGKVPGTRDQFDDIERDPGNLEFIEGYLIVKIPEPLTFANTGDLKTRLKRLELYGTNAAHPALPRVRTEENNKNIIFDVHGVTGIDGSGVQVLTEIVKAYIDKGVKVFFCRLPKRRNKVFRQFELSGIVDLCGGSRHFVDGVDEAIELAQKEQDFEEYSGNR